MKTQIHELRIRIDGLAQLVKSMDRQVLMISRDNIPPDMTIEDIANEFEKCGNIISVSTTPQIEYKGGLSFLAETYKSLLLSKAWLGEVLAELGEETPSKKYPVGVVGRTSHEAFSLAIEKGLNPKKRNECILISTPAHFKSCVFSKLTLPEDLSGFSEQMLVAIKYGKEQVFVPKPTENVEPSDDKYKVKFNTVEYGGIKFSSPEFSGFSELTYIEKIDWLRKKIKKVLSSTDDLFDPEDEVDDWPGDECYKAIDHLTEARFFLGFELSRIKEQSK